MDYIFYFLIIKYIGWKTIYTIHRLDRETSGVIIFAKKQMIAQKMASLFQNKQIKKIYSAIISKHLPNDSNNRLSEAYISLPIGRDINSRIRIKQGVSIKGKPSHAGARAFKNTLSIIVRSAGDNAALAQQRFAAAIEKWRAMPPEERKIFKG